MPIFEEQRKEKIQDMTGSASAVLRFIDGLLRSNVQDISIVVGSSSPHQSQQMIFSCFQAWVSLNCFSAEELAATCILPSLFDVPPAPSSDA